MTSLRHLHFVQSTEPLQGGGLGLAAIALNRTFCAMNFDSTVVATCAPESETALPHGRLYPRMGPAKAFFSPQLRREAGSIVGASDVVHGHGFYVYPNWVLGREARRRNRGLVYHPHGMFEPWILQRSRLKKKIVHLLFEDANFRYAGLWRALTLKEADQVSALGIKAPVVVAPNGIELTPFEDASIVPAVKERKRVLFLGRLHPKKGLVMLLAAWNALQTERQDWELILSGPDEAGHRAELEAIVRRDDLEGMVSFPGTVTGAEKIALLKSADLFILPSHSEGFSVAILEGMAVASPILATTACNFPELESDGGGWVCPPEPEAIENNLRRALTASEEERRERGLAGQKLVRDRYTWHAVARTILEACNERFGK